MSKKKRIICMILAILWMITIFGFSSQNSVKSSSTSGTVIRVTIKAVTKVSQEQEERIVEQLQHMVRKLAHFSIYAVGGVILVHLVSTYTNKLIWLYAWIIGTIYASIDELHQYFVPGRSCELKDVMIDSSGVITGIIIVMLVGYVIKKLKRKIG